MGLLENMNRLVGYSLRNGLRNGLRQQRICINQTRYLVTTQVGLAKDAREKLAEKKMFERKQEKQKEKDQETQAIGTIKCIKVMAIFALLSYIIGIISIFCQIC